eukprot:NODE_23405_length_667_cov_6.333333.p2 GENE.NODE_23405_length_667_cov_6.333333~~NODE_23405_length_667_cov_6.333333.p2  ORF type:complete len:135 (+),score=46.64 NODE_23405_length_667_cov_6.333333:104-508(+)
MLAVRLSTRTPTLGAHIAASARFGSFTSNVHFDKIAREWRCKWSGDNDKASLSAAQAVLDKHKAAIKRIDGVVETKRVVCAGCLDFKVITNLSADKYGAWKEAGHAPEASLLAELDAIDGITDIETQTFTLVDF